MSIITDVKQTIPKLSLSNKNVEKNKEFLTNNFNYKVLSKKKSENLDAYNNLINIINTEGKHKEKMNNNFDTNLKNSTLTPKNVRIVKLTKNSDFEKLDKNIKQNLKENLESEITSKQRNESINLNKKNIKKHDLSFNINLKKKEDKKENTPNYVKKVQPSLSPLSHDYYNSKKEFKTNNTQLRFLKESKSSQQMICENNKNNKIVENKYQEIFFNSLESKKHPKKSPLIDLATDFYEGTDVVQIDMGISYNSSINNNSLLISKNETIDENLKKNNRLDSIINKDIDENNRKDFENFDVNIEELNDQGSEMENLSSINHFKLNANSRINKNNVKSNQENKYLIENIDELIFEDFENNEKISENTEMINKNINDYVSKNNIKIAKNSVKYTSSPSTNNFPLKNLNNNLKHMNTNFDSTRFINTYFNLNSNKNFLSKKSTNKNSIIKSNTNLLKSEDTYTNSNNKKREKFPHSKTLKNLKNKQLNFMNNAFKLLTETQKIIKFEKTKKVLNFSKEKDVQQTLSFRVNKKTDNQTITNISNLKKENIKNSILDKLNIINNNKVLPKNINKKKEITLNSDTKKINGFILNTNNNILSSNKIIFNTTTDIGEEINKPYSQEKHIVKRKFITENSVKNFNLKESISKPKINKNLNNTLTDEKRHKKLNISILNENASKKKLDGKKQDNLNGKINQDKKSNNKLSDITFISNRNHKENSIKNSAYILKKNGKIRKSVSNNHMNLDNQSNQINADFNINQNNEKNSTKTNNFIFSKNPTINSTLSDKNLNFINSKKKENFVKSVNKNGKNLEKDNGNNKNNKKKNKEESTENKQKFTYNISQKYLKQFFSSLNNHTIIGNVNVNISDINLKITQNISTLQEENQNFNTSFKSNNYRNSEIPGENKMDISFESADDQNTNNNDNDLNENVCIEEIKLTKSLKKEHMNKKKIYDSPHLSIVNKSIKKILNRPVSEYKLINTKGYNLTEENACNNFTNLNNTENGDTNLQGKNNFINITENNDNQNNSRNMHYLKNNFSDKHFNKINILEKNTKYCNISKKPNNTYRNTINIDLNAKKNLLLLNNNNNNHSNHNSSNCIQNDRLNTYNNQKKLSHSSSRQVDFIKKHDSENRLNEGCLITTEGNIFNGKIEDYVIGKEIGKGAYAIVKQAMHKLTNRKFALKIYERVKLLDPERKGSVKREIQILKKLEHHENIVKLFEVIETSRQILLVMELVEGISLLDLLKSRENRRIDENECRKIYLQLVNAIGFCHIKNIIHRDIKLENIIVDSNLNLKLIDFGFGAVCPSNKLQSFFCGTPSYMPPEIVQKKEYIGYLTDIWSLGILLFTLLCGAFPFKANSEKDLYGKITKGAFTCPDHLSQSVCELIRKLLVVKPTDRPNTQEILNDKWFNSYYIHHKIAKDCIIIEENELNFNSKNN